MKKSYLLIAATALVFAACSNNELINDVNVQNEAEPQIGFAQKAIDKTTRAELNMDWFHEIDNAFGVYGYKNADNIFKNEEVKLTSKTETTSGDVTSIYKWEHATVRFWDKSAPTAYNFYAYAPFYGTSNSTSGANPTFTYSGNPSGFVFSGLNVIENITTDNVDKAVATAVEGVGYASNSLDRTHTNSPTVPFTFNHILSKLSFKIMTSVKPTDYATVAERVADITVKSIRIDFPSAASVTWTQTTKNNIAGTTSYTTYAGKDGTYETPVYNTAYENVSAYNTAHSTSIGSDAFSALSYAEKLKIGGTAVPYGTTSNDATPIGETFIVTPVGTGATKHEFDVEVIYDIDYLDGTNETNCIAHGTVGADTPGAQGATNVYAPAQNQYFIAVINIKPTGIEFCVEGVNGWNPTNGTDLNPVDVIN